MKTETNTDVAQLTDDQIDAVTGGIILNSVGPCNLPRSYPFPLPQPLPRTGPGDRSRGVDLNP